MLEGQAVVEVILIVGGEEQRREPCRHSRRDALDSCLGVAEDEIDRDRQITKSAESTRLHVEVAPINRHLSTASGRANQRSEALSRGRELVSECDLVEIDRISIDDGDAYDTRQAVRRRDAADLIRRVVVSGHSRRVTKGAPQVLVNITIDARRRKAEASEHDGSVAHDRPR